MPYFKPYYIFNQETTNAVMAALLVHDVRNSAGAKNPANRQKFGVKNPLELFKFESCHGGVWRAGCVSLSWLVRCFFRIAVKFVGSHAVFFAFFFGGGGG